MNLCTKIRVSLAKMRPYAVLADYGGKRRVTHYSWTLADALSWAACYNTPGALDADVKVTRRTLLARYNTLVGFNRNLYADGQPTGYLTLVA